MYKVNYQGLNPEIIEGLRDCTLDDVDDSLIYDDIINVDFDSINFDSINFDSEYSDD